MSLIALLSTAAALGLLGGFHCVLMCSAMQHSAIHGLGAASAGAGARRSWTLEPVSSALLPPHPDVHVYASRWTAAAPVGASQGLAWQFHAARLIGYAALGAAAAGGSAVLRWGADALPLMRPVWAMLNGGLLILGVSLLFSGRQPAWIDRLGQRVWECTGRRSPAPTHHPGTRRDTPPHRTLRPALAGLAWALMPCGLLYSALAVAVLASDPLRGAAVMLTFGAGTVVHLGTARALLQTLLRGSPARAGRIELNGNRLAGGALAAMAMAALAALAMGQPHPFC